MKLFAVALIFVCAIGTLVWVGVANAGTPVLRVEELDTGKYAGGRVRVDNGKVMTIESLSPLRFQYASASSPDDPIRVESDRSPPDNFKEGVDASLLGTFDSQTRTFRAIKISTACPSKYDGKEQLDKARRDAYEGSSEDAGGVPALPPTPGPAS